MKYSYFKAFVFSIILSGCMYTEGNLDLKGKVLDENTRIKIPNRKIIISALVKNERNFKSSYAGDFITDSSGCFNYTLKKIKNICLYDFCVVGDSVYTNSNNKLDLNELNRTGKFLTFYVSKLADLTIKIDVKSKTSSCDNIYVSWESNGIDNEFLYPYKIENYKLTSNIGLKWVGVHIKSSIKTKVYADKKTIIFLKLFRNGKYKEITDTIFCKRDVANSVCIKY
jgi:hypothetical protein